MIAEKKALLARRCARLTLTNIFVNIISQGEDVPISGKDMRKLFYASGYELVPGGGKGSHWKLKKKGYPTVIIPNDAELAKGTEHCLLKVLEKIKDGG